MVKGIELRKLAGFVSKLSKGASGIENYVVSDRKIPEQLNLNVNPENGRRKSIRTDKLEVIFTQREGKAYDVAVLGISYVGGSEAIAKRVARGQGVRYSNGRFFNNYSNSLREIKDNAKRIIRSEDNYSYDEIMEAEERYTRIR